MVFGARTFRQFVSMLSTSTEASEVRDPWVTRMRNLPATVVSSAMENPLDWPDATVVRGDAGDVVASLKEESDLPLRSHGSLSLNWTLMAAGLVDRRTSRSSRSSPDGRGPTPSSMASTTSISSSSTAGSSTATPKSLSTDRPPAEGAGAAAHNR